MQVNDADQEDKSVIEDVKARDSDPVIEIKKYRNLEYIDTTLIQLFELQDKNSEYIIIQTGVQRDLLDGGGHYHCYMLVNGQWIFLGTISWVS